MHNIISLLIVVFLILTVVPQALCSEGIDALIEVGRGQAEIQKAYAEETKTYKGVKSAIAIGKIKKGDTKDEVSSGYGEPVVTFNDQSTGREKWVYRPASSDAFKGERVNIYFDDKGLVDEIRQESKPR